MNMGENLQREWTTPPASSSGFFARMRTTLEMIKFEHSIFALPFALTGAMLAARGWPSGRQLFWLIVAMVGARSTAMAFNRIADFKFDAANPRTRTRALPAGQLTLRFAAGFTAVSAALLVLASILLISNTIRLSLFSRRREVEVMKLVGATDWFIRWPFVLEGLFLGAIGGAAAIGLLALAKVTLVDPLPNTVKLISQPDMIAFPLLIAILMGCAIAVSAAGSGISLRRFLRV